MALAPEQFSDSTRAQIAAEETNLVLSAASVWEIAIKYARGTLPLPQAPTEYVNERLKRTRTRPLPITHAHALRAGELPRHHRDPFDRLLVAQAQLEGLRLVTDDPHIRRYDVEILDP
jgi:PIN domain nuclease of toxin-antitoxin system